MTNITIAPHLDLAASLQAAAPLDLGAVAQTLGDFATAYAQLPGMSAFAHMCTAAEAGEQWAVDRLADVVERLRGALLELAPSDSDDPCLGTYLYVLADTDTSRPDGAAARGSLQI